MDNLELARRPSAHEVVRGWCWRTLNGPESMSPAVIIPASIESPAWENKDFSCNAQVMGDRPAALSRLRG